MGIPAIGPAVNAGVSAISRIGPQALGGAAGAVSAIAPVEAGLGARAARAVLGNQAVLDGAIQPATALGFA